MQVEYRIFVANYVRHYGTNVNLQQISLCAGIRQ